MKRVGMFWTGAMLGSVLWAADPLYLQDFSKTEPGTMPDEILVLDGQFAVREDAGDRFVELPGAPLESYGFLFGPSQPSGVEASGRILATKSGRKFPTFGIGLNGASGYRLQVAPAKGTVEILRGDNVVASAPFVWKSGEWTELRIRVRRLGEMEFRIEGLAWTHGGTIPAEPLVTFAESKLQPAGRASVWGMPFSGTPIRFDDLKVATVGGM